MQELAERPKVGRKKREIPSDYVGMKVPRDVHDTLKLLSSLTGEDMAAIAGNLMRDPLMKLVDEAYRAKRAAMAEAAKKAKR